MSQSFLSKEIDEKSIVWFKKTNQYVVVENHIRNILSDLDNNVPLEEISNHLSEKLNIPSEEVLDFVKDVENNLYIPNLEAKAEEKTENEALLETVKFSVTKYFSINNIVFKIDFESDYEDYLITPKFSHLELEKTEEFDYNYQVFSKDNTVFFYVNSEFIGSWSREEVHYFQGKLSMYITQHIHQKEEKDWLGVFHASAVSNGKKSVLFLGDSGNGKSTSLALLQANGFTCLADDFVPFDVEKKHVYAFPSGISIKRNSVPVLLDLYPELENTAEYHFKNLNKIVRFLKPNNADFSDNLPCNDLVFIKYKKDSDLQFNKISSLIAFEKLVPDSWLSPIEENAQVFLDWFSTLNCYELVYSDNKKMIAKVNKLFSNDL